MEKYRTFKEYSASGASHEYCLTRQELVMFLRMACTAECLEKG